MASPPFSKCRSSFSCRSSAWNPISLSFRALQTFCMMTVPMPARSVSSMSDSRRPWKQQVEIKFSSFVSGFTQRAVRSGYFAFRVTSLALAESARMMAPRISSFSFESTYHFGRTVSLKLGTSLWRRINLCPSVSNLPRRSEPSFLPASTSRTPAWPSFPSRCTCASFRRPRTPWV